MHRGYVAKIHHKPDGDIGPTTHCDCDNPISQHMKPNRCPSDSMMVLALQEVDARTVLSEAKKVQVN